MFDDLPAISVGMLHAASWLTNNMSKRLVQLLTLERLGQSPTHVVSLLFYSSTQFESVHCYPIPSLYIYTGSNCDPPSVIGCFTCCCLHHSGHENLLRSQLVTWNPLKIILGIFSFFASYLELFFSFYIFIFSKFTKS